MFLTLLGIIDTCYDYSFTGVLGFSSWRRVFKVCRSVIRSLSCCSPKAPILVSIQLHDGKHHSLELS